MRQTGGRASGATSTRSRSRSWAMASACSVGMTPTCSPFSSMSRTCGMRMRSLILVVSRSGGRRSNLRGTGTQNWNCAKKWVNAGSVPQPEGLKRAFARLTGDAVGELRDRHRAGVAVAVLTHGHRRGLGLAVADDQHVGHLAQLAVADLAPDRLRAVVDLGADAGRDQPVAHLRGRLVVAVGDRQHERLDRRQPDRELAGVVLEQNADEALVGAHERAMDHHRLVLYFVGAGVGQPEALGHRVVELDGAELPRAPERVGDVQVDLRPVEGAVALVDGVLEPL